MERPASAKRGGAFARIWLAIAAIVSPRVWSAMVTGPKRQRAGICSAYRRAEQLSPGIRTMGRPLATSFRTGISLVFSYIENYIEGK
jgi:hypothetical protein